MSSLVKMCCWIMVISQFAEECSYLARQKLHPIIHHSTVELLFCFACSSPPHCKCTYMCTQLMQHSFSPIVSHNFCGIWHCIKIQHCASRSRSEEGYKLVHMQVNNAGFNWQENQISKYCIRIGHFLRAPLAKDN